MRKNEFYFPKYRISFESTSLSEWKEIFKGETYKKYPKKSIIVNQGEDVNHLYFINKGLVEYTSIAEDGTEELVDILGDGNLFCLQSIFGRNPSIGSFITLEDSLISSISISQLKSYIDIPKNLAIELLEELSKITNGLTRQIFGQRLSAEEIIYYLAEYYERRKNNSINRITIPLSQMELAKIARTTRVTVAKVLSKLRRLKLIDTAYAGIIVYNLAEIKK
jgi:CRP/FNR family transcriptional regulator, cyclic AMP receptor protein